VKLLSPSKKAVMKTRATGKAKNNSKNTNTNPPASQTPGRTVAHPM
jgi:hypothetical protein